MKEKLKMSCYLNPFIVLIITRVKLFCLALFILGLDGC